MKPTQQQSWTEVTHLFEAALELRAEARSAFLERACAGNAELRREVQSLLQADAEAGKFMEIPACEEGAPGATVPAGDGATEPSVDAPEEELKPGSPLGRYVVRERLGTGGMGVVYLADDPELNRKIALKLMRPEAWGNTSASEGRARLMREAQAMARLSDSNVIAVYDVGTFGEQVFIAMEHVEGTTLGVWMSQGAKPWHEVLSMFVQAGCGLTAAHSAGILHRDFKPENVLVGKDGRARVMDFGLARAVQPVDEWQDVAPEATTVVSMGDSPDGALLRAALTEPGRFMGTPRYMAPEQLMGQPATEKSDQFSFCVALYQGLYGALPFDGETVASLLTRMKQGSVSAPQESSSIPVLLRPLILRGLRPNPADRYSSMDALLDQLVEAALSDALGRPHGAIMASPGATVSRRAGGAPVPRRIVPHLFLVFDSEKPLGPSVRFSLEGVDTVELGRAGQFVAGRDGTGGRRLVVGVPDSWVSTSHAVLRYSPPSWILEDTNSQKGTLINGRLEKRAELVDGDLIELGHSFFLFREALATSTDEPALLKSDEIRSAAPGLMTLLPCLAAELRKLEAIADSTVSVVLQGESGTGKEVAATALHRLSGRPGPFLPVNCGGLPETLFESELFGSRKGAFSGADKDRPGLVRSAERGTLFLDEISELPASAQAALLRVLQDGEILPIGATQPIRVDVRFIAATNRDLDALVVRGLFRTDLLARISGFVVWLPPVRERREDLGILIAAILKRQLGDRASEISFSCAAARALLLYQWPLNIRELEKWLAASAVLAGGHRIELEHLPVRVSAGPEVVGAPAAQMGTDADLRKRNQLLDLLREYGGNISSKARFLGKARTQVQRWMRRYRIDRSFNSSIKIQPEPDAYREKAKAYESSNRPREAEATYRSAIQMRPTYWAGYRDLAVFFQNHGRFDEALPLFEKVIELTPDNYLGWANLGGLYLRLGMHAKAKEYFDKAISIGPTFAAYYIRRSHRDVQKGQPTDTD